MTWLAIAAAAFALCVAAVALIWCAQHYRELGALQSRMSHVEEKRDA